MSSGGAGDRLLATGAADATVAIWEDVTAADEEAEAAEEAAVVLKQQDLSNALQVPSETRCLLDSNGRQHGSCPAAAACEVSCQCGLCLLCMPLARQAWPSPQAIGS